MLPASCHHSFLPFVVNLRTQVENMSLNSSHLTIQSKTVSFGACFFVPPGVTGASKMHRTPVSSNNLSLEKKHYLSKIDVQ